MKDNEKGNKNYCSILLFLVISIIVLIACNPVEQQPHCIFYHSPVDSAYMAIENIEYSYNEQDLSEYLKCIGIDFEFYYESNGDTLSWGFDTEQEIHQSMFNQIDDVWLEFSGTEQYPWSGDTTGSTLVLPRDYYLRVFIGPDDLTGTPAYGTSHFICRQDSMEEWYIWQWWDYPDTGKDGWGNIKVLFMTPPPNH